MKIDLKELVKHQIITQDTADKIENYYQKNEKDSSQRLMLIFGIIGAVLTGLGIILLIAHNWDELSRTTKTFLALLPLLISQAAGFYTLTKKTESKTWREVSAVLIFFSIAAAISMIAQIYHISGDFPQFLITWLILSLPLVYIFDSSFVSLLYIAVLTSFVISGSSWQYRYMRYFFVLKYLLLLAGILPYYFRLIKKDGRSNMTAFHHWFIAGSLLWALTVFKTGATDWRLLAYISLLGIYVLIGQIRYFRTLKLLKNAYYLIGISGLAGLLIFFSFDFFWETIREWQNIDFSYPAFWLFIILFIIYLGLLTRLYLKKQLRDNNPFYYLPIIFTGLYFLSLYFPGGQVLSNLTGLITGLYFIRKGNKKNDLLDLNFGMLLISSLIIARFFDTGISFVTRGILFILLGMAFFIVNYILVQKKKKNEV